MIHHSPTKFHRNGTTHGKVIKIQCTFWQASEWRRWRE